MFACRGGQCDVPVRHHAEPERLEGRGPRIAGSDDSAERNAVLEGALADGDGSAQRLKTGALEVVVEIGPQPLSRRGLADYRVPQNMFNEWERREVADLPEQGSARELRRDFAIVVSQLEGVPRRDEFSPGVS